ncbi:MAG: hypothetical protein K9J37_01815 [Saprospiraceae bacterium]|nr:hypothetical protein [Saprospiraceae bacterium]MCF8248614.1 hypothetical protein [Saprospiraceae bacterium]MCF8281052.1 hypothetical protein [Bacteroidales bacterium]MCF8310347.1 hypothetical protein [Saprospiraceae bacterium]MCF8442072.1 hypothetical protein [Saprospiraceae bacterium]
MKKDMRMVRPMPQEGGCSQKKITVPHFWEGGASGLEHDWMEPMNWFNRHVPEWFDKVVIPSDPEGRCFYPIIDFFVNDIAQLVIEPDARLVISQHGKLTIDGLSKKGIGILNFGELIVKGELTINRTNYSNVRNNGLIHNAGSIAFDQPMKKGLIQRAGSRFENFGETLFF